jgi:hypothetical protein
MDALGGGRGGLGDGKGERSAATEWWSRHGGGGGGGDGVVMIGEARTANLHVHGYWHALIGLRTVIDCLMQNCLILVHKRLIPARIGVPK